jgi:hypothetical protein
VTVLFPTAGTIQTREAFFFIFLFYFFFFVIVFDFQGLLLVEWYFSSGLITNSTFENITTLVDTTVGSVLYVHNFYSSPNITMNFTVDKCVFARIRGGYNGPAIFLFGYYITITRTRFEDNSCPNAGKDIVVLFQDCFSNEHAISPSTCSTSIPPVSRIFCQQTLNREQLQNSCSTETVFSFILYFFIFIFF